MNDYFCNYNVVVLLYFLMKFQTKVDMFIGPVDFSNRNCMN